MRYVKVYGKRYPVAESANTAIDGYVYKGKVVDTLPKGKSIGYATLEDGSIVECFKSFNPIPFLTLLCVCGFSIAGYTYYMWAIQPKDLVNNKGLAIKSGDDSNIVMYNGFAAIREDQLELDFQNGELPVTVTVSGPGVETETFTVDPETYVESVPVTFTTDAEYVDAEITISTETSTVTETVTVEILDNQKSVSDTGEEGNWRGEQIYGVQ